MGAHKYWRFRGTSCQPGSVGGSEGMLVELEMWAFGVVLYQLCTRDGETLWKANQADNISPEEMQDLAYRWVRIDTLALFCRDWN